MNGWIKLHRRLLDQPRFDDPAWLSVWIYLLLNATHQPVEKVFDGRLVTLRPGQLITGRHVIAAKTGVHPSKVYRVLEMLKSEQQIEQRAGTKSSILTVLNWQSYQQPEQQIEQQASSRRAASEQQLNTIQEEGETEEAKKENKSTPAPHATEFAEFWDAYPKKVDRASAERAFSKLADPAALLPIMLKTLEVQKQSSQWKNEHGRFIPHPATWLNGHRWEDDPAVFTQGGTNHANRNANTANAKIDPNAYSTRRASAGV